MAQNISTNGIRILLIALPLNPTPLEIDHLSADTDPWSVSEVETGGAQVTPDGQSVFYGKNARFEATLTLNGASRAGARLSYFLMQQQRNGSLPPIVCNYTITIYNDITGESQTYLDGNLLSGTPAQGFATDKKKDLVFTFSFAGRA